MLKIKVQKKRSISVKHALFNAVRKNYTLMVLKVPRLMVQEKICQYKEDTRSRGSPNNALRLFVLLFLVFNLFHFRHANITLPKMGLLNIGLKSNDLTVNYKNKYVDFHHKRHQFFFKILP